MEKFDLFLDGVLLYIIGLEVALMMIKRDPNLVIDILIFALCRKLIIQVSDTLDFLIGVLSILILYFIKCYGISCLIFPKKYFESMQNKNNSKI